MKEVTEEFFDFVEVDKKEKFVNEKPLEQEAAIEPLREVFTTVKGFSKKQAMKGFVLKREKKASELNLLLKYGIIDETDLILGYYKYWMTYYRLSYTESTGIVFTSANHRK